MAYKLVVTDEGEERIDEQLQYILFELENENAAKHYLDCIEKIYENIEDNPYIYEQSKDKLLSMMGYHEARDIGKSKQRYYQWLRKSLNSN